MLDGPALVSQAIADAGADDFGGEAWRAGFDRLVDALNGEAQLSELGEASLGFQLTTSLRNRLQVTDWATRHPEVTAAPVRAPLIVIGLPRSGTTLVSYLLDCDPARRSLLRWESQKSVPPPEAATLRSDPRVAQTAAEAEVLDQLNPDFAGIHYEAPDGPTEDVTILAHDFRSFMWECLANVGSYARWLRSAECDFTSAYAYHRRQLQVLQSRAPGVWCLKTPQHCLALPALFAEYPDARLVMTHRDPVVVTASMVSLVRSLSGTFSDADHRAYINQMWPDTLVTMVERVMAWRDGAVDDARHPPIVDLAYTDLLRDPLGTMGRLYDAVGDELTDETEAAMRRYLETNPRGRRGGHWYRTDDLGLDAEELAERFAPYIERYAIAVEHPT